MRGNTVLIIFILIFNGWGEKRKKKNVWKSIVWRMEMTIYLSKRKWRWVIRTRSVRIIACWHRVASYYIYGTTNRYVTIIPHSRKRCILRATKRYAENRKIIEIESEGKKKNKIRNNITLDTHALTSHIVLVFPSNVSNLSLHYIIKNANLLKSILFRLSLTNDIECLESETIHGRRRIREETVITENKRYLNGSK